MSSTLVTPLLISVPWGVGAANPEYIKIPIPVPSQTGTTVNAASFTDGFPPSTMTPEASGGLPFFGQDMNGILYMLSAYCANFAAGAIQPWSSALSSDISGYPLGALVLNGDGTGFWFSTVNGNTTDPDTGGAGWQAVATVGTSTITLAGTNVTLSALQAAAPLITLTGALSANVNVVFPQNEGQGWIIANETTGAFSVTVSTSGGTPISVPQTGASAPTSIYSDGTNVYNTGVSTAGLAPINSPALTGTPTAPTASASTNTTQIATTAMVQAAITAALSIYAKLASPNFTGVPTAPTPSPGDNSLKLATTAFVAAALAGNITGASGGTGFLVIPTALGNFKIKWGQTLCNNTEVTFPGTGGNAFTSVPVHIGLQLIGVASSANVQVGNGTSGIPAPTPTTFYACGGNVTVYWFAFGF